MIEFINVSKKYPDGTEAVKNFNLEIEKGELVVFIGSSGSGKTTTMRMINRMEEPTSGQILINGQDIREKDPVQLRRKIGYVIQSTGLMPHMTVYKNITMVPHLLNWDEDRMREKAISLMEQVNMDPDQYFDRYPSELSGGQQQRIGVIRALAADQDVILMDEPFGALDPITRESLQDVVMNLQKNIGRTVIFVTHDMDEALKIADKIAILSEGNLIQFGTPSEIMAHPANDFVREFIGEERLNAAQSHQCVESLISQDFIRVKSGIKAKDLAQHIDPAANRPIFLEEASGRFMGQVILEEGQKIDQDFFLEHYLQECKYVAQSQSPLQGVAMWIFDHDLDYLPVLDEDQHLLGIVTQADLLDLMNQSTWGRPLSNEEAFGIYAVKSLEEV